MNWVKKTTLIMSIALLCSTIAHADLINIGGNPDNKGLVGVGRVKVAGEKGLVSVDVGPYERGQRDARQGLEPQENGWRYMRGYNAVNKKQPSAKRKQDAAAQSHAAKKARTNQNGTNESSLDDPSSGENRIVEFAE